jgi:hypothetical protein
MRYRDTTDYRELDRRDFNPFDRWAIGYYSLPLAPVVPWMWGGMFATASTVGTLRIFPESIFQPMCWRAP